uniref:Uncharacterized protein n=1 Tax=Anguilla anguilla TaxID=7936 RepID=A0A0E9WKJ6_ANGAN
MLYPDCCHGNNRTTSRVTVAWLQSTFILLKKCSTHVFFIQNE